MMRRMTGTVSMALLLALGACDNKTLSRSAAGGIIENTPIAKNTFISLGFETLKCLEESGFLRTNMFGAKLSDSGKQYFSDMQFSPFDAQSAFAFVQPVHFKDVEVTGITEPQEGAEQVVSTVEFTAGYRFDGVQPDSPMARCLARHEPLQSMAAIATKYDDGWRVDYRDIPQFYGPSM